MKLGSEAARVPHALHLSEVELEPLDDSHEGKLLRTVMKSCLVT